MTGKDSAERRSAYVSYDIPMDRKACVMANTATLSSKFRISIPKAVRNERKWKAGLSRCPKFLDERRHYLYCV
jgi:hypothetical protein